MKAILTIVLVSISSLASAQQWQIANGTAGDPIAAVTIFRSNPDTVYALGAGYQLGPAFLRSTDSGNKWDSVAISGTPFFGTDIGALQVDPYDSRLLYASVFGQDMESNDIDLSTDGGFTWKVLFIGHVSPAPVIEIDPITNTTVYVAVGPGNIRRSTNQGQTWDTIPEPEAAYTGAELTSLAVAPSNDSILYVGYTTGIFKSADKGNTWQSLDLGFGMHSQTLLAVDPRSADTVYAAVFPSPQFPSYLGGVYKSTDGGKTWKEADSGLTDQDKQIMSMTINPKNADQIFIGLYGYGTQGKLCFQSTSGGDRWRDFTNGLPDSGLVNCIDIDTANNRMYAGVGGYLRGLYTTDIITGVNAPVPIIPSKYHLLQNYPNPFNPSTTIMYDVPRYSRVEISVYDVLGRKVGTLVDNWEQPGTYTVRFDASRLASGVYFYQLISESFFETKKMILLR